MASLIAPPTSGSFVGEQGGLLGNSLVFPGIPLLGQSFPSSSNQPFIDLMTPPTDTSFPNLLLSTPPPLPFFSSHLPVPPPTQPEPVIPQPGSSFVAGPSPVASVPVPLAPELTPSDSPSTPSTPSTPHHTSADSPSISHSTPHHTPADSPSLTHFTPTGSPSLASSVAHHTPTGSPSLTHSVAHSTPTASPKTPSSSQILTSSTMSGSKKVANAVISVREKKSHRFFIFSRRCGTKAKIIRRKLCS